MLSALVYWERVFSCIFCPLYSSCATGSCSSSAFTRLGSSRTRSAKGMQKLLLGKSWKQKLPKICKSFTPNETAAQHLKVFKAMLGKQVAGSPWLQGICKKTTGISSFPSWKEARQCGKIRRKNRNLFSAHAAPRVKSRFAVGGPRRGLPKMLKTRSLPTTWFCKPAVPPWDVVTKPTMLGKIWDDKNLKLLISDLGRSWEKLWINDVIVMWRIFRHLCLRIAGFHLQLNFPSQSAHAIEFVDRISCAGNDGPSHHHKCDSHHSNFLLNAVAGQRKPGPKATWHALCSFTMGAGTYVGHAGTPTSYTSWCALPYLPRSNDNSSRAKSRRLSNSMAAWVTKSSMSWLRCQASTKSVAERVGKSSSGQADTQLPQNKTSYLKVGIGNLPCSWDILGPRFERFSQTFTDLLGQHCHEVEIPAKEQLTTNLCT